MPSDQTAVLMILSGAFLVLSLVLFLWGRHERNRYRYDLAGRPDLREFLTNWPPRWWLKTLTMGSGISLAIGIVLAGLGLIFFFNGR